LNIITYLINEGLLSLFVQKDNLQLTAVWWAGSGSCTFRWCTIEEWKGRHLHCHISASTNAEPRCVAL